MAEVSCCSQPPAVLPGSRRKVPSPCRLKQALAQGPRRPPSLLVLAEPEEANLRVLAEALALGPLPRAGPGLPGRELLRLKYKARQFGALGDRLRFQHSIPSTRPECDRLPTTLVQAHLK